MDIDREVICESRDAPGRGDEEERRTTTEAPARVPSLAIIIVNYRTTHLTIDCLRSLESQVRTVPGTRAVVIENGSGDDSTDRLRAAVRENGWEDWCEILVSDENLGFSGGNNRAAREYPNADYVLLLNNDTIVHEGCLRACFDALERDPTIGVVSSKVLNEDGSIQNVARKYPTPARSIAAALTLPWRFPRLFGWADLEDETWDRAVECRDVDWLGGEFLFVRGDVWRSTGGLDEDFFFYGEDLEFCHRVRRAGYRLRYDPATSVTHLGGGSSTSSGEDWIDRRRWQARYLVQEKCWGKPAAWTLRVIDLGVWSTRWMCLLLTGKRGTDRYAFTLRTLRLLTRRIKKLD